MPAKSQRVRRLRPRFLRSTQNAAQGLRARARSSSLHRMALPALVLAGFRHIIDFGEHAAELRQRIKSFLEDASRQLLL